MGNAKRGDRAHPTTKPAVVGPMHAALDLGAFGASCPPTKCLDPPLTTTVIHLPSARAQNWGLNRSPGELEYTGEPLVNSHAR